MDIIDFLKKDFKEYYSKDINEQFRRGSEFKEKQDKAHHNNSNRHVELVEKVNKILTKYSLKNISKDQIRFFPGTAGNITIGEKLPDLGLSEILYDFFYPSTKEKLFSHYTSIDTLDKILIGNNFRLYSPLKRKLEGEYKLFYSEHNLKGYSLEEIQGVTFDEYLMSELFYISLIETNNESKDQIDWCYENFGDNEGVKLNLSIDSNHPDFRNVFYRGTSNSLAKEIADMIKSEFEVEFVYSGLSRIGAFFIHENWIHENETRFLIKKWAENYLSPFDFEIKVDNSNPYIDFDLTTTNFATIQILNVEVAPNADISKVKEVLKHYPTIKLIE